MLTRFVRTQLAMFVIASVIGVAVMVVNYIQMPTLLGIGRITVTLELPRAGGLYRFANVTYRGVQIGKVTAIDVDRGGATATLSLDASPRVPDDLVAEVRSVSAVGEQYVDLQPRRDSGPYLRNGSVIPAAGTVVPQPVGPMLDRLHGLVGTIPKDQMTLLLDETFRAFDGAGYDMQSLADSTSRIATDAESVNQPLVALTEDSVPVLESQAASADTLRAWSAQLASVGRQLVINDPQVRGLLDNGPGTADEVSRLLNQLKPTLPVLLANLTSIGQVAVTYHPGLEQLLVLLPPAAAFYLASAPGQNATGIPIGDFRISVSDPPACTTGFLPPSAWRTPADTTTIDTPDGLYCKLPQDSPIAVRGARNTPCMDAPGKYAPTVAMCKSNKPFQPLATRQHATGPYPFDPNLVAQGVPPDRRVPGHEGIFGPVEGTPAPPPSSAPVPGPEAAPVPGAGVAIYDPTTGRVAGPAGTVFEQSDLSSAGAPKTWEDMVFAGPKP
ncbi:MlaD family protein [Mycobacterium sp. ACS4331]|uniref:MCE family protein n=1 Tax=Mycobacterium sp. ACS4331 TaxID=1834121 RepID=UPI000800BB9A|nr:MlaD family protein [Mycobacterium sp. ACS4331]OBF11976.1 virulence factor Mce [Mycobacterium sp. ACS4331]